MILNNDNVICEISCKTVLSTIKTFFDYKEHAKRVAKRLEGKKKKFVVFCGCGEGKKETIHDEFDKINNCRLFYLWVRTGYTSDAYIVDESFYDFIDFIKNLQ